MTKPVRILVVDDEEAMREVLRERLAGWDFEVDVAEDGAAARRRLAAFVPDIVLSDVMLPDVSGVELLGLIKQDAPLVPVVMITAHGTVELAVEAMKLGAADFLTKPIDYEQLQELLAGLRSRVERARARRSGAADGLGGLVGGSAVMREVYDLIENVAGTDVAVLITGESGTGKEVTAHTIHDLSRRRDGAFIAVNCAAIPAELMESELFGHEKGAFTGAVSARPGCFELAHRGTLLLDEIAEMPKALQPKLLRVLEDGKVRRVGGRSETRVDVRQIAATNRDPEAAVKEGVLREDLYYRLNVLRIHLPPLRKRLEDLPSLVACFVAQCNSRHGAAVTGVADDALGAMSGYDWPGNVRELRNVIERGVVLAKEGEIQTSHLPVFLREADAPVGEMLELPFGITVAEAEKELILRTLEQTSNNKAEAARWLGVDVKTIRNKLKSYNLG